jgi:hypothetical protein
VSSGYKIDAIYKLYPSVVRTMGDVAYDTNRDVVNYDNDAVEAEAKMIQLREERDRLLAETDYLALSDNTMSAAMTTYRQALRDITDNATSLDDVTWPTKP